MIVISDIIVTYDEATDILILVIDSEQIVNR